MEAAKKLLQFNFDSNVFTRYAPHPMTINQDLRNLIEKIIDKYGGKDRSSVQKRRHQIYLSFIDTSPRNLPKKFSTFSQVRRLSRILTYSENRLPRIVDIPELCYALQLIEDRFSMGALRGVYSALRQAPDALHVQMLQAFVKKYQTNPKLLPSEVKSPNILLNLKMPSYTNGYRYFGAVAGKHISISKPTDKSGVADIVKFTEEHNDNQTNCKILSELIEQLGNDASEYLRQPVQSYLLQKWQTPWRTNANWKRISDKARRIFARWIIEKDFQFFSDGIAKNVNNSKFESRKAFWAAYLEYISLTQPVLNIGAENLYRHNQQDFRYYRDRRPATLITRVKNQHALIIEMRDHIFVEFSTMPTCYVYDKIKCPFKLNSSEYHIGELKNSEWTKYHRISGNSAGHSWQSKLASWIATELDIKPLRSYRLDGGSNSYTVSTRIKS